MASRFLPRPERATPDVPAESRRRLLTDRPTHYDSRRTQGWVDPERRMIFVLMIQRTGFGNSDAFQELAVQAIRP